MPMANQAAKVTIGGIGLNLTAVPDKIEFGLKEGMNVHRLVGGSRVVDMTGDDPDNFIFSGTWLGPSASDHANEMYAMQQQKKLVQLQFGSVLRDGVVAETKYVYKRAYWIDFTITFLVIEKVTTQGFLNGNANAGGFDNNAATAGDNQINQANNAQNNTANDAADNLNTGVDGQAQVLGAGQVTTNNPVTFADGG